MFLDLLNFGPDGWGKILLSAVATTVSLTLVVMVIGAFFGSIITFAKLSSVKFFRILGELYSIIFRGLPELLIIYLFYFGSMNIASSLGRYWGSDGVISIPAFLVGALAVGLISGSYQTEVFRAAYFSVSRGELEAGRSIGMSRWVVFHRILIPQILRFALPGLGNVWQMSLKDSSLVSVIGIVEIIRATTIASSSTDLYFQFYITGACLYLVITLASNQLFYRLEARVARSFRQLLTR